MIDVLKTSDPRRLGSSEGGIGTAMSAAEITRQRERLLLTSKRLIIRTRRLLEELQQLQSEEAVAQLERKAAEYWWRFEIVEQHYVVLRAIVDRGEAVLN